jgi:hypothetical protein
MGDSLAQGFKNGGIYRTDLSFPALLSRAMGNYSQMDLPSFSAQAGIPINMEVLVRGLEENIGDDINLLNSVQAGHHIYSTLKRIKSYWEGQVISLRNEDQQTPYHNQAVWGFSISDCWLLNEKFCREYIRNNKTQYSVFSVLPDQAMYTTARLVLNPTFGNKFESHTQIDNIRELSDNGGIENLIACLGHNNVVGAVTKLKIEYSTESDINAPFNERRCTVFRPEHFEQELKMLYNKLSEMNIKRVFVPTIPYVTIPPAIRGVNSDLYVPIDGYFDYYARFWIWDEDFDPDKHPHLTRDDAIKLDEIVDQYNHTIKKLADKHGFVVVPVARHVQSAARRRHLPETISPFPDGFIKALQKNPKTSFMVNENGEPNITTDYLRINEKTGKVEKGGIFSLDGLHPSTIGYGLIANIYKMSMEKHGVKFEHDIDWDFVIENETLVTDPPKLLHNLRLLLRFLALGRQEKLMMFGKGLLQEMVEVFSSSPKVEEEHQ